MHQEQIQELNNDEAEACWLCGQKFHAAEIKVHQARCAEINFMNLQKEQDGYLAKLMSENNTSLIIPKQQPVEKIQKNDSQQKQITENQEKQSQNFIEKSHPIQMQNKTLPNNYIIKDAQIQKNINRQNLEKIEQPIKQLEREQRINHEIEPIKNQNQQNKQFKINIQENQQDQRPSTGSFDNPKDILKNDASIFFKNQSRNTQIKIEEVMNQQQNQQYDQDNSFQQEGQQIKIVNFENSQDNQLQKTDAIYTNQLQSQKNDVIQLEQKQMQKEPIQQNENLDQFYLSKLFKNDEQNQIMQKPVERQQHPQQVNQQNQINNNNFQSNKPSFNTNKYKSVYENKSLKQSLPIQSDRFKHQQQIIGINQKMKDYQNQNNEEKKTFNQQNGEKASPLNVQKEPIGNLQKYFKYEQNKQELQQKQKLQYQPLQKPKQLNQDQLNRKQYWEQKKTDMRVPVQKKKFEYKPGMRLTDAEVNKLSDAEIYEYFTQVDLEEQVGFQSKIILLGKKKTQIEEVEHCPICMEDIEPSTEAKDIKLDCDHLFHYDCIKQWLQLHKNCPICKDHVELML